MKPQQTDKKDLNKTEFNKAETTRQGGEAGQDFSQNDAGMNKKEANGSHRPMKVVGSDTNSEAEIDSGNRKEGYQAGQHPGASSKHPESYKGGRKDAEVEENADQSDKQNGQTSAKAREPKVESPNLAKSQQ